MRSPVLYYLHQYQDEEYKHGGIGFADVERIWQQMGLKPVSLNKKKGNGFFIKSIRIIQFVYWKVKIKKGDTVAFIFPSYATLEPILLKWLAKKGVHLICLIGDINGLRLLSNELLKKEISYLSNFSNFIVHNESMAIMLQSYVAGKNMVMLQCFDFITAMPCKYEHTLQEIVAYAGNLEKAVFLKELNEMDLPVLFNLYGEKKDLHLLKTGMQWKGSFSPEETLQNLDGSFGLIWDGDSIHSCEGVYGEYVKYNSPHKFSLYVLAGIPIIVWRNAAIAPLVEKYNIGICVNTLQELPKSLVSVTTVQYEIMKKNLLPLAKDIRAGKHVIHATEQLLKINEL